jgi:three-Cys-motif partner protein
LKNQPFSLAFFDAFAGTGQIELAKTTAPLLDDLEAQHFIDGSAQRALQCKPTFDEYVFVEKSMSKVGDLDKLKLQHPEIADRIHVKRGEANHELERFCRERDWRKWRAVIFLDPYGNQVSWQTLEKVAATQAIDLWYLFPAGPGVHRQISGAGTVDATHEESLDRLMGTRDWRTKFIDKKPAADLFDEGRLLSTKTATIESITEFMIERMKTVFEGGVLDEWLLLSTKGIKYALIFASANPNPKVWALASKLAKGVLRSTKRGRIK